MCEQPLKFLISFTKYNVFLILYRGLQQKEGKTILNGL